MDRSDYDDKMQELLNDKNTYEKVSKSPFKRIERELNQQLLQLKREQKLDEHTYKKLHSTDGIPPVIRGSVKTTNQITHFDLSLLVGTQHFTTLPNSFQTYFHHFKTTMATLSTILLNLQRNFAKLTSMMTKS